jgi:hypothetical protein
MQTQNPKTGMGKSATIKKLSKEEIDTQPKKSKFPPDLKYSSKTRSS